MKSLNNFLTLELSNVEDVKGGCGYTPPVCACSCGGYGGGYGSGKSKKSKKAKKVKSVKSIKVKSVKCR